MHKLLSIENIMHNLKDELSGGLIINVARDTMDIDLIFIIKDMGKIITYILEKQFIITKFLENPILYTEMIIYFSYINLLCLLLYKCKKYKCNYKGE